MGLSLAGAPWLAATSSEKAAIDFTSMMSRLYGTSGVSVTGSAMFDLGSVCHLYAFARGTYFDGKTDYWRPLGRLGGQSNAKIWEGDFGFGKGFDLSPNVMLTPYIGGGLRSWDRDLCQGGACFGFGFHENYSHSYAGGALCSSGLQHQSWF